jgi:hypothetical protein
MELVARSFVKEDYPQLEAWWKLHSWPPVPIEILPPNGIVIEYIQNGISRRICAGFLYLTDTPIAWLEYILANPLCDKLLRDRALDVLIPALLYRAKEVGKSVVFSSVEHPSLIKRYERHGGIKTDSHMTNFIWRLS